MHSDNVVRQRATAQGSRIDLGILLRHVFRTRSVQAPSVDLRTLTAADVVQTGGVVIRRAAGIGRRDGKICIIFFFCIKTA